MSIPSISSIDENEVHSIVRDLDMGRITWR